MHLYLKIDKIPAIWQSSNNLRSMMTNIHSFTVIVVVRNFNYRPQMVRASSDRSALGACAYEILASCESLQDIIYPRPVPRSKWCVYRGNSACVCYREATYEKLGAQNK